MSTHGTPTPEPERSEPHKPDNPEPVQQPPEDPEKGRVKTPGEDHAEHPKQA
jgi:hypothetical protein